LDGILLAYLMALPLYFVLRTGGKLPVVAFGMAGVLASQVVHALQNFRQPALREFAISGWSPLFGLACGLSAGACFVLLRNRRFPRLAYGLPAAVVTLCGCLLVAAR
jgi:hypothetical protein